MCSKNIQSEPLYGTLPHCQRKVRNHNMIKAGKMPLEDIADYTELPLDIIEELKKHIMQMA